MTIHDLKQILKGLPDNTEVAISRTLSKQYRFASSVLFRPDSYDENSDDEQTETHAILVICSTDLR